MKVFRLLIFPLFLLLSGCGSFFDNQMVQNPPEFEALIQELDSELNFNNEQLSSARSSIDLGRDFHPDPASLWELAVKLQKTLTQEQKDLLFSKIFDGEIISEENDHHHGRLKHFRRMDDRLINILNEDQIIIYQDLKDSKLELMDNVILEYENEEIDRKRLRLESISIMEWFRAEIKILLTDEQYDLIITERGERDFRWRRGRQGWGRHAQNPEEIKLARQNALELTADQILALENLRISEQESLDVLKNSYVSGSSNISGEEFRLNIISIIENSVSEKELVFTKLQKEIIEIHRALVIRYMRYTRWGNR